MNSLLQSIGAYRRLAISLAVVAGGAFAVPSAMSDTKPNATRIKQFRTSQVVCYAKVDGSAKPRRYDEKKVTDRRIVDEDSRGFYLLGSLVGEEQCWVRAGQVTTDRGGIPDLPTCLPLQIADGRAPGVRNVGEGCR